MLEDQSPIVSCDRRPVTSHGRDPIRSFCADDVIAVFLPTLCSSAILGVKADSGAHLHALGGLTMVHTCVVAGCRNRRTPGTTLSFYRFPRDPERKQRWIAAVNRAGWVPNDGSRLCSTHFISGTDAAL